MKVMVILIALVFSSAATYLITSKVVRENTMKEMLISELEIIADEYELIVKASPEIRAEFAKITFPRLFSLYSMNISNKDINTASSLKAICRMNFDSELINFLKDDNKLQPMEVYLKEFWLSIEDKFEPDNLKCELKTIEVRKKD